VNANQKLRLAALMELMQADGEVEFRQVMERLASTKIECTEGFLAQLFQLGYVRGIVRMQAALEVIAG
jgi:hypothetical protein